MAYDTELADRIRAALGAEEYREVPAFGGLAFMIGGNMAVSASGRGGLMVHCAAERTGEFVDAGAERMVMRGRPMNGWLQLDDAALADDAVLARWVAVGRDYARSLPPK